MTNTKEHYRMLNLTVPLDGKGPCAEGDPWLAGRTLMQAREHLFAVLGATGGLQGNIPGHRTDRTANLVELSFGFWYENLETAVNRFAESWQELRFPERTRLTHVERFPDASFKFHVMLRWVGGKMNPWLTSLSDDNLLTPHNA